MQRKWYRSVLEKDIEAVNGLTGKKENKTRLMNIVMQVRCRAHCWRDPKADKFLSCEKSPATHISSMELYVFQHNRWLSLALTADVS
jgi:hypothetical protein